MSYAYTPVVGRECLVTFQKNPRVLDENESAVRVIAAIATVEAVGEETVSLLMHRIYPHRGDIDAGDDEQPYDEPEPPLELTLRADAILAMSPVDEEDVYDDDDDVDDDDDDVDEDDDDGGDDDDGERVPLRAVAKR